eukprot:symbB.v1.2.014696.t1/scaffold1076.1/size139817/7
MGALVAPRQSCKGSQSLKGCASQRQGKRKVEHRQLEVPEMDEDPMLVPEIRFAPFLLLLKSFTARLFYAMFAVRPPNSAMAELNLRGAELDAAMLETMKDALQEPSHKIIAVDVSDNALGDEGGVKICHYLMDNQLVRRLAMNDNDLGDEAGSACAELLAVNKSIEQLDLEGNYIFNEGVKSLSDVLPKNSTLQHLNLGANQLGIGGAEVLAMGLSRSSLTSLNLSDNRICGRGAEQVLLASKGTGLVFLDLARNEIGPQGLELMCGALESCTVSSLSLAGNRFGADDAAKICASCINCEALEVLLLQQNDLGPEGAKHVADMLPKTRLTALDLTGNSIGDTGTAFLASSLEHLGDLCQDVLHFAMPKVEEARPEIQEGRDSAPVNLAAVSEIPATDEETRLVAELRAAARYHDWEDAQRILGHYDGSNSKVLAAAMHAAVKCRKYEDGATIFESLNKSGEALDVSSYSLAMNIFGKLGETEKAKQR